MGFQQGSDLNTTSQPPNTQQMTLEVLNSCFPALGVVRNKAGRFGVFVETKQLQKMYKLLIYFLHAIWRLFAEYPIMKQRC